jgi:hypothetical protein
LQGVSSREVTAGSSHLDPVGMDVFCSQTSACVKAGNALGAHNLILRNPDKINGRFLDTLLGALTHELTDSECAVGVGSLMSVVARALPAHPEVLVSCNIQPEQRCNSLFS